MKIGILGGSFNPPHFGHLNVARTVKEKAGLNELRIVPSSKNPLKKKIDGPSAEERLELTRIAFSDLGMGYVVDDREVKRGKTSYTIHTLEELKAERPQDELYLIIGMDLLSEFEEWKDWKKILDVANLIVCSRPGFELPRSTEDLPEFLRPLIADQDFNFMTLKSGKEIQFVAAEGRRDFGNRLAKVVEKWPFGREVSALGVELKIKNAGLYAPLRDKIGDYEEFAKFIAHVLFERKAIGVRGFDLRPMTATIRICDHLFCHVHAACVGLGGSRGRRGQNGIHVYPQSLEGADEGRWVLVDYGSLIVHVFYDYIRQEYSLETCGRRVKI